MNREWTAPAQLLMQQESRGRQKNHGEKRKQIDHVLQVTGLLLEMGEGEHAAGMR
jgi:hypothetical protein